MKTKTIKTLIVGSVVALISMGGIGEIKAEREGHGGNSQHLVLVNEFTKFGRRVVRDLNKIQKTQEIAINPEQLLATIEETKVIPTESSLFVQIEEGTEVEVDAKNYSDPVKKIIFNVERWENLDKQTKKALVLHEYLGVMGIEVGGDYHVSSEFLDNIMHAETFDEAINLQYDEKTFSPLIHNGRPFLAVSSIEERDSNDWEGTTDIEVINAQIICQFLGYRDYLSYGLEWRDGEEEVLVVNERNKIIVIKAFALGTGPGGVDPFGHLRSGGTAPYAVFSSLTCTNEE